MLLQKDFGLQVGLDNFESLVKSLLELKPPLIYDFGFICLKILGQTSDRIWFTILWARDVPQCVENTQKWVDGAYEFTLPISRFVPIFLWQTVANFRFLWVNISWYLYCNNFQLFWRENSNDILVEMVMCDIRNGIKHKKLWLLHGRESRFDP